MLRKILKTYYYMLSATQKYKLIEELMVEDKDEGRTTAIIVDRLIKKYNWSKN